MNPHYEAVLADLEQMKAEVEDGIRAVKLLMSRPRSDSEPVPAQAQAPAPKASPTRDTSSRADEEDEKSVPTRVLELLASQPNRSFRTDEIADGMGGVNIKTLRGALGRLYKFQKLVKTGRGKFKARKQRSETPESEASTS